MFAHLFGLIAGLVVLTLGAEWLVRGAASLALRFGMSALVVGLTVVAFGTSAPELVVSLKAAMADSGDIAAGNVIGSNIFNIGVILGLTALVRPLRTRMQLLKFDAPVMVGSALMLLWVFDDRVVSRVEGMVLAACLVAYLVITLIMARRGEAPEVVEEFESEVGKPSKSAWMDLLWVVLGLTGLVLGSRWLVDAAVGMARLMGIGEAVIGLTIIAAGTSLPELATSVVAAFRKEADIAVGNLIGSNIFNAFCIVGICGTVHPYSAPGLQNLDLWVMTAFAVLLLPMMIMGRRLSRVEGAVLLAGYGFYLYTIWPVAGG